MSTSLSSTEKSRKRARPGKRKSDTRRLMSDLGFAPHVRSLTTDQECRPGYPGGYQKRPGEQILQRREMGTGCAQPTTAMIP